jgi:hypothetical protein
VSGRILQECKDEALQNWSCKALKGQYIIVVFVVIFMIEYMP